MARHASWACEDFLDECAAGGADAAFAAMSPGAKSGLFYVPVAKENLGSKYSQDPKLAAELWDWTEAELKGLEYHETV